MSTRVAIKLRTPACRIQQRPVALFDFEAFRKRRPRFHAERPHDPIVLVVALLNDPGQVRQSGQVVRWSATRYCGFRSQRFMPSQHRAVLTKRCPSNIRARQPALSPGECVASRLRKRDLHAERSLRRCRCTLLARSDTLSRWARSGDVRRRPRARRGARAGR